MDAQRVLQRAEGELNGEPARIYDRVAGRAVDPAYEEGRRAKAVAMIAKPISEAARRLIWC
jgi:hypothetical protein